MGRLGLNVSYQQHKPTSGGATGQGSSNTLTADDGSTFTDDTGAPYTP